MDAEQIIMSLPAAISSTLKQPEKVRSDNTPVGNGGLLANLDDEPVFETTVEQPVEEQAVNVIGALMPRGANVQIFHNRYRVTGSIQIPGSGTFYMDFQNVLVAEDKLVTARRDLNDSAFSRMLYKDYLEPLKPINVLGEQDSYAYRFAGSPFYDKGWFEDVWCGCAFALPIWKAETMTNLWIIDGSKLYDCELRANPNMTTPKAPKWEGKVH